MPVEDCPANRQAEAGASNVVGLSTKELLEYSIQVGTAKTGPSIAAAPEMEANGVRKSCETALNNDVRMLSVSSSRVPNWNAYPHT
jgi:hypothetical protein